eukprot:m.39921 g.39921  ORF g.39921 m.39921 type:complete len:696 (+) comp32872_c0_seq6:377-2464(+)
MCHHIDNGRVPRFFCCGSAGALLSLWAIVIVVLSAPDCRKCKHVFCLLGATRARHITARKHSKVVFLCPLRERGSRVGEWQKNNETWHSSYRVTMKYGNAVVEIAGVLKRDGGAYVCFDSKRQMVGTIVLKVVGVIAARVEGRPANGEVLAGSEIEIICTFRGSIIAHWYKDGSPLKYSNRQMKSITKMENHSLATIVIKDVQPSDAGRYYCVLVNRIKSRNSYPLRVNMSPVLKSPTFQYILDYAESVHAILCDASAVPGANITWYKITPGRLRQSANNSVMKFVLSAESQGRYVCICENAFGLVNSTLLIKLQESIKTKTVLKENEIAGENNVMQHSTVLNFEFNDVWPLGHDPGDIIEIKWKKEGKPLSFASRRFSYEIGNSAIITLLITDISVRDSGKYTVIVRYKGGERLQASRKLSVYKWPEGSVQVNASAVCNEGLVVTVEDTAVPKTNDYLYNILAYDMEEGYLALSFSGISRQPHYFYEIRDICDRIWAWSIAVWVKNSLGESNVSHAKHPITFPSNDTTPNSVQDYFNGSRLQFSSISLFAKLQVSVRFVVISCKNYLIFQSDINQKIIKFVETLVKEVIPGVVLMNQGFSDLLYLAEVPLEQLKLMLNSTKALSKELADKSLSVNSCHLAVDSQCGFFNLEGLSSRCNTTENGESNLHKHVQSGVGLLALFATIFIASADADLV